MLKRSALLGFLFTPFLVAACAQPALTTAAKRQKLLIQMSEADPAKWNMALNNAKNVQDELGAANVDIEIVAFGPGINMIKFDSVANSRVSEAMKAGIAIVACENTLRNLKMSRADIITGASYVPAGVVQIMRRQGEGWSYVRP
jgi:intracellular sulfur oxidation DsrE/DsrF family protein